MDNNTFLKKLKKPAMAVLILLCLLSLGIILFRTGKTGAPPSPKEGQVSRMYVVSTNLAVDKEVLAEISSANVSADKDSQKEEPEEEAAEQDPEETQTSETTAEEQHEADTQNPEVVSEDSPVINEEYDSLSSLIHKNDPDKESDVKKPGDGGDTKPGDSGDPGEGPGTGPGTGGSSTTLTEEESGELFYTSIVDGEIVTDPNYFFTITLTERGRALNLISQTVSVNGAQKNFQNGDSVGLSEGANKIRVTLRFRDQANNQVDAPSKEYTVYYYSNNRYWLDVMNAATMEHIQEGATIYVAEPTITLKVTAGRIVNNEARPATARVRCNTDNIAANDAGLYVAPLRVGENTFTITTGTNVNQISRTFKVNYLQESFSLTFDSDGADKKGNAIHTVVNEARYNHQSSYTWASDGQEFRFLLSHSNITGAEKIRRVLFTKNGTTSDITTRVDGAGYRTVTLEGYNQDAGNFRGNKIQVDFTDSFGREATYIWTIVYERSETPQNYEPFFNVSVVNGQTVNTSPLMVYVNGVDHNANTLMIRHFTVTLNGREVESSDIVNYVYYGYELNLQEGPNTLVVTAKDNEQYSKTQTFQINYRDVEDTVYVNLLVEAQILGLPVLLNETIPVSNRLTVARVVEDRLAAYGFTTVYEGNPDQGDYYLMAIGKEGILNGWNLTQEQIDRYTDEGYEILEPANMNVISERDITLGSGWLVTLNNVFISTGMGNHVVRDGDTIHIQYTLDLGRDVGIRAQ